MINKARATLHNPWVRMVGVVVTVILTFIASHYIAGCAGYLMD